MPGAKETFLLCLDTSDFRLDKWWGVLPVDPDAGLALPPALVGRLEPRTQPLLQVKRVPDATIIAGSTQRSFEDAGPDFFHFFTLQIGRRRKSQLCHFRVAKVFRVTERFQTEFRGSFFNVGNFANFDIPGHTPGNADFGIISPARPARTVQLALRLIF